MTEHSSTLTILHVVGPLHDDISRMCKAIVPQFEDSKDISNINIEFEIRLGNYEKTSSDKTIFTPGLSYEEFSRFYTYLEDNCKKIEAENYLDIYCRELPKINGYDLRTTIKGSGNIMDYCTSNNLPLKREDALSFQIKMANPSIPKIDIDVYDMRLSVSGEVSFDKNDIPVELKMSSLEEVNKRIYEAEKQFRYKKRTSYVSPDGMFRYDLTQVKQVFSGNGLKSEKTLSVSEVFNQQPVYEVELEFLYKDQYSSNGVRFSKYGLQSVLENITLAMQIRQDAELVLVKDEKYNVIRNFLELYYFKEDVSKEFSQYYMRRDKQYSRMFPGAKVSTLERVNLIKDAATKERKPYIYKDYTVTDKADGERFILFVDRKGRVYLVDDRMNVLRTDIVVRTLESTMIDGELVVTFDKGIKVYNYFAFDILYLNSEKTYEYPLFPKTERDRDRSRFYKLENTIRIFQRAEVPRINGVSIFNISAKNYRVINDEDVHRMKEWCGFIWNRRDKGFRYDLDGLIFTPKFETYPIGKFWSSALKWKPPVENSIDFLVKFRSGDNAIRTTITKTGGQEMVTKYQLADLYVGESVEKRGVREYVEKKFDLPNTIGTDPTYLIKIPLGRTGLKDDVPIRSDTIIECVWEDGGWKVLKTRLDKTQRYLASGKNISNTANNIAVAISIWSTIVEPITTDMITGVEPVEDVEYYSKTGTDLTEPMRGFNNYMKTLLISGSRKNGDSLIDFSCGRGGDIKKWFSSDYRRVVGLDISRGNIESMDPKFGATGRIEHLKNKFPQYKSWSEGVKFFWADTSKITTSDHPNGVCQTALKEEASKALAKQFDVGASFFTAHYYFESPLKIRGFFQNLFDNIRDGGLAVITCFDGLEIFKWLENLETGQVYSGLVRSKPVWQIKKAYNKNTPFLETSSNVGLKIDIKFESISDDYYTEYLLHPKYFTKIAEEYGFSVISDADAKSMFNLKSGTALFGDIVTDLDNAEEMKRLHDSELGKVFYRDINSLVNDDDYADLREWNKHNRYFILRKNAKGDMSVPKGWRSRLSKYDCEHEYKEDDTTTTEGSETAPKKRTPKKKTPVVPVEAAVVVAEEVAVVEAEVVAEAAVAEEQTQASLPSEETNTAPTAPKKRVLKKKTAAVPVEVEVEVAPTTEVSAVPEVQVSVAEEKPAPKKRTLKKKTVTEGSVTESSVAVSEPVTEPIVENTPALVPEVVVPQTTPKKRVLKKKAESTVTSGTETVTETETVTAAPAEPTEEVSVPEKPKKKAPAGKKKLDVAPSVLEQLLKGTSEQEEGVKPPIEAETKSELECVVDKAPAGTKVKVPKKLLGKKKSSEKQ
jgi:hypothetical protein